MTRRAFFVRRGRRKRRQEGKSPPGICLAWAWQAEKKKAGGKISAGNMSCPGLAGGEKEGRRENLRQEYVLPGPGRRRKRRQEGKSPPGICHARPLRAEKKKAGGKISARKAPCQAARRYERMDRIIRRLQARIEKIYKNSWCMMRTGDD